MWWKKLGFENNPLDIRPSEFIINYEKIKELLINTIESGYIVMIYGPLGVGKTSLLLNIRKIMIKKGYCAIYINADKQRDIDIENVINKHITRKILGIINIKRKCRVILLIDEFQNLSKETITKIKYLYDSKKIYSIVISQVDSNLKNAPISFVDRIYTKVKIEKLSRDDIIKLIEARLGDKINIIDATILDKIIEEADYNPREILISLSKYLQGLYNIQSNEIIDSHKTDVEHLRLSDQQLLIVKELIKSPLSAKELSSILNISYNTISKQLSRLVSRGILEKVVDGPEIKYKISDKYKHKLEIILGDLV